MVPRELTCLSKVCIYVWMLCIKVELINTCKIVYACIYACMCVFVFVCVNTGLLLGNEVDCFRFPRQCLLSIRRDGLNGIDY